jgi:YcxB-like protein
MLMMLEYRIRADEEYYVTAYARYRRQLWWYRWLRPTGVLVWIASVALIYFSKGALADWPSIGLFLFVLLVIAALIFSTPLDGAVSRRRIRKIPTLNDDWVIRLSDDGMSSSGKRGEGRLHWSGFSKARRFADGLLLFQGPYLFHWFPDSACTQTALPSEVGDLVRRHVFDYRDVGRRASSDETQTARGSMQATGGGAA